MSREMSVPMSKPDRPPPLWTTLGWVSWVAVCLIILAGTAIWLSDSKDVDRAGVVLGPS
jgi:hypothetical protein